MVKYLSNLSNGYSRSSMPRTSAGGVRAAPAAGWLDRFTRYLPCGDMLCDRDTVTIAAGTPWPLTSTT
jgi:hypothetical protein